MHIANAIPEPRATFTHYLRMQDERVSPGLIAVAAAVAGAMLIAFYALIPEGHASAPRALPPLESSVVHAQPPAAAHDDPYVAYAPGGEPAPAMHMNAAAIRGEPIEVELPSSALVVRAAAPIVKCSDGYGRIGYADAGATCLRDTAQRVLPPRGEVIVSIAGEEAVAVVGTPDGVEVLPID